MTDGYRGVPWRDIVEVMRIAGFQNGVRFGDLDDHAQDAVERLLKAVGPRDEHRKVVLAYAYRVSAYAAKDRAHAATAAMRGPTVALPDWDPSYACEDPGYLAVEALDLLRRLRPIEAQALMAAFVCGTWSEGGIGSLLGVSSDAASQRVHRARRAAGLVA